MTDLASSRWEKYDGAKHIFLTSHTFVSLTYAFMYVYNSRRSPHAFQFACCSYVTTRSIERDISIISLSIFNDFSRWTRKLFHFEISLIPFRTLKIISKNIETNSSIKFKNTKWSIFRDLDKVTNFLKTYRLKKYMYRNNDVFGLKNS